MILADSWYTSGTLWAIAGVIVGALSGIGGMWAVRSAASPHRQLVYAIASLTRLVADFRPSGAIEVRHRGKTLNNPHVATFTLANRGRFDIPKAAFEESSLSFDFGVPIIEMMGIESSSSRSLDPYVKAEGSILRIGPTKLEKGLEATFTLLVEGATRSVGVDNPIVDVKILSGEKYARRGSLFSVFVIAACLVLALGSCLPLWFALQADQDDSHVTIDQINSTTAVIHGPPSAFASSSVGGQFAVAAVGILAAPAIYFAVRRFRKR